MKPIKRTVMFAVAALACAGVYGALRNLPIVSGCAFYGECPQNLDVAQTKSGAQVSAVSLGAKVEPLAP